MRKIDKLAWIEIKNRKILSTRSIWKEVFYIPWGKREWTETDIEALRREIQEELDVQLIEESMNYFWTFEAQADGKWEWILVTMTCYTAWYTWTIHANSEIEEVVWFRYEDKEKSSAVDKMIFQYCKDNNLID